MSELAIQIEKIPNLDKGAIVVVRGSIDAKTVIQFQRKLNSVIEDGTNQIIIDMEHVKYVNSTGLGYLINLADTVGGESGQVVFSNVQPKVKVVFDMLGLNAFFRMFNSRDHAMKAILGEKAGAPEVSKTPPPPRDDIERTQPIQVPSRRPSSGTSMITAPPPRKTPTKPPSTPSPQRAVVTAQHPPAGESVQIECRLCKASLILEGLGTYKCPRCFAMFNYSGSDRLIFLPKRPIYPIQMTLNFTKECTEGLLGFIQIFARHGAAKGEAINGLQNQLRTIIESIRQHAYGGNPNNIYHVQVITKDNHLEIRFVDYGRAMSDQTFSKMRGSVDRLEIRPHPRGGNILTIAKNLE